MERIKRYVERFKGKRTAVAYSGGVDSSLIAFVAKRFADAITIRSEFTPRYTVDDAINFSKRFGINHRVVDITILDDEIKRNSINRCYLCKKKIFREIKALGYDVILDGTNADDLMENRPGLRANEEERVVSPLADLGLGKRETRGIMYKIDKKIAMKPSETCLATRIPFNSEITLERLRRIDKAEEILRSINLSTVRVRDHFPLARIQVPRNEFNLILDERGLVSRFKDLGYRFVTLDLEGYELNP
ncbi:MAG TPA: ATP-dependent sacrificial sulfur transferase LarE [Candidatus Altiarchaeales archaeon]|nr:ATP-dependent sacrificial sulfur transferase LarE [Candidatus Altiarchaeales archaeon]